MQRRAGGLKIKPGRNRLMQHTRPPAGAYWSAELHWAQDDSPGPLFWWSASRNYLKRHLAVPSVAGLVTRHRPGSLLLRPASTWALHFPPAGISFFFFYIYFLPPLNQMRFDLSVVWILSRRDRGPLFKGRSERGAAAWKLTVSAPCTLADKRSRLKKKEIHMFTIPLLCCIREKMLRTHKMTDLQNAAAAGRTPQIDLVFLRGHWRQHRLGQRTAWYLNYTEQEQFSLLWIQLVETF